MKKRIFTLFFALAACAGITQAAIVDGSCGDNLTWLLNTKDSTLTITGSGEMTSTPWSEYNSYIKYVSLPDGLTSIGNSAFMLCTGLTSVTIPNSVTSIGNSAFSQCNALTSVTIGNSVTSIGELAFYDCSGLTSVTIPNSVTSIGGYAFVYCSGLTSVTIPNSVTSIGDGAFSGCSGMTSVTIGNSVTSIGEGAFYDCSGLTSVTIGNSVTSIGSSAFTSCSITTLTVLATTPPSGGSACGINADNCTLYVPIESVNTYANTIWWEDFASIRAIGSGFIVKFLNWNETVLSSQEVDSGEDAIAPANPTREGYTFIGWDKEFTNITEDLVVTAQYKINRFEVVFKDWDGVVLKSDSVDWNTAAIAPTSPSREGYTFIGWDKEFSQVTENMTITAQYELGENKTVTVIFANGNDESEILSQQLTMKVPSAPSITGFTFLGWYPVASVFAEPENTITIQAVYQADVPSSAPAVYINPANPAQKLIKNGNVYILTDDKTYSIDGRQVR